VSSQDIADTAGWLKRIVVRLPATGNRQPATASNSSSLVNAEASTLTGTGHVERSSRTVPATEAVAISRARAPGASSHRRGRGTPHGGKGGLHNGASDHEGKVERGMVCRVTSGVHRELLSCHFDGPAVWIDGATRRFQESAW
jgi:hypothetical protein